MRIWWRAVWDAYCMRVAWVLPRRLVYWCAIRVGCNATQDEHSGQIVPDLLFMDAIKRWRV